MSGGSGNVLKVAAPLALGLLLPGVGSAIGAGLTSALGGATALGTTGTMLAGVGGQALAGAGIGGLGAALTGQKIGKGALLGGIGGGIAGGMGQAFPETFGAATNAASSANPNFAYSAGSGLNAADTQHISGLFDNVPNAVSTVAAPAASTGGIGGLMNSKYLIPALGGAASLLASGEKQKPTLSRNDAPAHNVAAMNRTSMPVDQSVYYGTGGGNRRYLSDTPEVQFMAEGGTISKPLGKGQAMEGVPANTNQKGVDGGRYISPEMAASFMAATATPAPAPMPIQPLQRTFQQIDPSVYYGVGGMRDYFSPIAQDNSMTSVSSVPVPKFARGGGIGHLIQGAGDGTSDDIPAMLSDGEYVIPAAAVSALGNGSNKAGAKKLDAFKSNIIKKHYKSAKAPKSLGIGSYMQGMAA